MSVRYNKNYLTFVIARVDFSSPLKTDELPASLRKTILEEFPIPEPKTIMEQEVIIIPQEKVELKGNVAGIEWNFHGKMREKLLVMSPTFLSITYEKSYGSFEILQSEFLSIVEKLFEVYENIDVVRLGLRYINEISLPEKNPLSWEEYLNPNLLTILDIPEKKEDILREFSELILKVEDMNLTFKYGIHNPDFPAPIRRKIFILDFDAQYASLQEYTDIKYNLAKAHTEIENLFERCIKNRLRVIMNE